MKVSTKGRYALKLMLELALSRTDRPVRIREIAKSQEISDKYLEQIISVLNKAGMVKSIRGPQGGYLLTRRPEEYTVGEILRLMEGSMTPVACVDGSIAECPRIEECAVNIVWKRLDEAIRGVVDNITLADLADWQVAKSGDYTI